MSKTLKQLLDQVNGEIGFDIPQQYVGSTDPNIVQLLAIANRSAIVLRDVHLQPLIGVAAIDLDDGTAVSYSTQIQSFALPDDFLSLVPDTTYQNGRIDMAAFPTSPDEWNYLMSRTGPEGFRVRCRIENNKLMVFSPEAGQTLTFEYLSKYPVFGSAGGSRNLPQEQFASDEDIWRLDDALIEMDVIWRYKRAKGLDWQGDQGEFIRYSNALLARDRGASTISYPCDGYSPNAPFTNLWVS